MPEKEKNSFIAYEYKELVVPTEYASFYLDCYEAFGWERDENYFAAEGVRMTTLHLRRNRKLVNKAELTRLQRNFEACINEIKQLERSKSASAKIWSLAVGIIGTVFMAGSVFAVTAQPPHILLCIILAVPAFLGWIFPLYIYRRISTMQGQKLQPLIEEKQDEIYEICEKGHGLL